MREVCDQLVHASTATAVKPGFFSNWRKANFKSFIVGCQWLVVRQSIQIPSSRLQINPKPQIPNIESTAHAGGWRYGSFFGIWSLVVGNFIRGEAPSADRFGTLEWPERLQRPRRW